MAKQLFLFNHPSDLVAVPAVPKEKLKEKPVLVVTVSEKKAELKPWEQACKGCQISDVVNNICLNGLFADGKFTGCKLAESEQKAESLIKCSQCGENLPKKIMMHNLLLTNPADSPLICQPCYNKLKEISDKVGQKEKVCYKCGQPNKNTLEKPEGIICYGCLTQYHIEEMQLTKEEPAVEICPEHAEFESYLINTESNIDSYLTKNINTGGKMRDFVMSKIMDPALPKELSQRGWELIQKFDQEIFRRGVEVENNLAVSQMFREVQQPKEIEMPKKLTPEERKEICVHAETCRKHNYTMKCSDECKNRPDRPPIK